jgi:hypothetical protein
MQLGRFYQKAFREIGAALPQNGEKVGNLGLRHAL